MKKLCRYKKTRAELIKWMRRSNSPKKLFVVFFFFG